MKTIELSTFSVSSLESGVYRDTLPEIYQLQGMVENGPWHNQQDIFEHVVLVVKNLLAFLEWAEVSKEQQQKLEKYLAQVLDKHTRRQVLLVATILHDVAKKDTLITHPDGSAGCPGHVLLGAHQAQQLAPRFGLSEKEVSYVERIVRYHDFINETLRQIISSKDIDKYAKIFKEVVGDVYLEVVLFYFGDLSSGHLDKNDPQLFDNLQEALFQLLKFYTDELE